MLPLLSARYGLDHSQLSSFLISASLAAFLFNLASIRLLELWSDRTFLLWAAALQFASVAAVSAGGSFRSLVLWGLAWGAGNSALGLGANLLVIAGTEGRARSRAMGFLHLFYGLACVAPAIYVAAALARGWGLAAILSLPAFVSLALLLATPFAVGSDERPPRTPASSGALPHGTAAVSLAVTFYVLGEALTSMWLVSALHEARGLGLPEASRWLGGFFLALSSGRAVLAAVGARGREKELPFAALGLGAALLLAGTRGPIAAFAAAGFAMGPFYPLLMTEVSVEFPHRYRGVLSAVYSSMTLALAFGHGLMGLAADRWSLRTAFLIPAACLALSAASLAAFRARRPSSSAEARTARPAEA